MKGVFTRISTILFNEFKAKCENDNVSFYEGTKRAIRLYSKDSSKTIDKDALINQLQAQLESEKEQYSTNMRSLLDENKAFKSKQEVPTLNTLSKYPLAPLKEIFNFTLKETMKPEHKDALSENASKILLEILYGGS